jgi:hypothetical protein
MNSFLIWSRSLGQNPVRKLEAPTTHLAATEMRPAFRAREAIASKASTPLTNTTTQESRLDPNPNAHDYVGGRRKNSKTVHSRFVLNNNDHTAASCMTSPS